MEKMGSESCNRLLKTLCSSFLKGNRGAVDLVGRGAWEGMAGNRGRGGIGQDVLYGKRIKKNI